MFATRDDGQVWDIGGELATLVAALDTLLRHSNARRVVALLDQGTERAPLMVDCLAGEAVEITHDEHVYFVDPTDATDDHAAADLLALPDLKPVAPVTVDPESDQIVSKLGTVEYLGRVV